MKKIFLTLAIGSAFVLGLSSCQKGDSEVKNSQLTGQYIKATIDTSATASGMNYLFTNSLPTGKFQTVGNNKVIVITTPSTSFPYLSLTIDVTGVNDLASFSLSAPKICPLMGTNANAVTYSRSASSSWSSVGSSTVLDNITLTKIEPQTGTNNKYLEGIFSGKIGSPARAVTNGVFRALIVP